MRHASQTTVLVALLALAACGEAPLANRSPGADLAEPAGNAAEAPPTEDASPSGNASWAAAQPDDEPSHRGVDFIAFNHTGRSITAIAVRPDEGPLDPGVPENPWGENVLVQSELPDGQRSAVHLEPDIELCTWQIRATFDDGDTRDYPTVDLCETVRVDLR